MGSLSAGQLRFIRLHQRHFVERWQNVLGGGMIRATTNRGVTATISTTELDGLYAAGLMTAGHGIGLELTEMGQSYGNA